MSTLADAAVPGAPGTCRATAWRPADVLTLVRSGLAPNRVLAATRTFPDLDSMLGSAETSRDTAARISFARPAALDAVPAEDAFALTLDDPRYPSALRALKDAPAVLYGLGDPAALTSAMLGMTGTRKPTRYGSTVAELTATAAAGSGVALVAGGAAGCDSIAAKAAVQFEVPNILVTAGAPEAHPAAAWTTSHGGVVLSEHPFGTPKLGTDDADRRTATTRLLARNRIIVGLSSVFVVTGGGFRSGTANAAWRALGEGRPVVVAAPRPHAHGLPDTQLPRALAAHEPVTVAQLRQAGCPRAYAEGLAGPGPLASAVAADPEAFIDLTATLLALSPDS